MVSEPLDAAGTRSAIGLTSANLDTQLDDLPTVSEFNDRTLPSADYFVVGDYTVPPTAETIATEVWAFEIESTPASVRLNESVTFAEDAGIAAGNALVAVEAMAEDLDAIKGTGWDGSTDSLKAISDGVDEIEGGSGGGSVNVLPATGIVASRSPGATLNPVVGETISQSITLYGTDGTTAVSLVGKTLAVVFETLAGVDVAVVANASITVSGDDDNVVTFAYPSAVTASERTLRFAIRDEAAPLTMYLQGICNVVRAPQVDV